MGMLKDESKKPMPTGYQQGILLALGSQHGDRFGVRCIDRWYPDHVQPIFGTKVYAIADWHKPGRKQYIVKSVSVSAPHIDDVVDWRGFCRAWLEIHGGIKPVTRRRKTREIYHVPGFRIYGEEHILQAIMHHLPIQPRKIQEIKAITDKIYEGKTYCISIQSPADVFATLEYIDGLPRNERIWDEWAVKLSKLTNL